MPTSFIDLERGKGLYCCFPPFIPSAGHAGERLCLQQGKGSPCSPWDRSGAGMSLLLGNTGKEWDSWPQLPVQSRREWSTSDLSNGKITNIFHFKVQLNIEVLWLQDASFPTVSWSDLQIPLMSLLVKMWLSSPIWKSGGPCSSSGQLPLAMSYVSISHQLEAPEGFASWIWGEISVTEPVGTLWAAMQTISWNLPCVPCGEILSAPRRDWRHCSQTLMEQQCKEQTPPLPSDIPQN